MTTESESETKFYFAKFKYSESDNLDLNKFSGTLTYYNQAGKKLTSSYFNSGNFLAEIHYNNLNTSKDELITSKANAPMEDCILKPL